jgi:hypothetical protein
MGARWGKAVALLRGHERLLFALMIVVQLIPIWAVTYLPTTDGAAHVGSAEAMRKMGDPSLTVFRKYYYVSSEPSPNLIGHLAVAGLMSFCSAVVAEKVLVSLYIVLFPLAVRYAVRAIRRSASPLAFLAFPMVYSYLFAQGFYNFCLSIAVFFFVVGYWIRNRNRLNAWRGVVLAGLGLLLYVCHLFSLMMAVGVLGVLCVWFWVKAGRAGVRRVVVTGLAFLPVMVMAVLFRPSTGKFAGGAGEWTPKQDLVDLLQFHSLVSYRNGEVWLGGGVAGVFLAMGVLVVMERVRGRGRRCGRAENGGQSPPYGTGVPGERVRGGQSPPYGTWDGLLLVAVGLFGIYFLAHDDRSAHFYIPQRVMLYAFLVLLLWLAGQAMTVRVRWLGALLGMIFGVGFGVSHGLKYRQFSPQLHEFVSAGREIRRNSTFLPLIFAPRGIDARGKATSIDVAPFYMAAGYIAADRDAVDLRNYEANTDHFPVRFVKGLNPYEELAVGEGFDEIPPRVDFEKFRRAGGEVDYVLLWGVTDAWRKEEGTVALYRQLAEGFEKVEVKGAKRTEVWKRRGL